jgi:membrane protease YdiL (CAAX protease family)
MSIHKQNLRLALWGAAIAIAITTTMDATGFTEFSALPLFGIVIVFWSIQKFSASEMGFNISQPKFYLAALLYPAMVMTSIVLMAWVTNVIDLTGANWGNTRLNIIMGCTIGTLMVMITEEGFFRGWLWATLRRAGLTETNVLVSTTIVFMLWHVSWATLPTGFGLPADQVPIYLANVLLIGGVWGKIRMMSDSVLVASVSHAVWNAFAYSLFGIGPKVGDLGIHQTAIFGPEVGWLGVAFNLCFLVGLFCIPARQDADNRKTDSKNQPVEQFKLNEVRNIT